MDPESITPGEVDAEARRLIEAWCDRRCLSALRCALAGYPRLPLTDGWANFMDAMKNVRASAQHELTEWELSAVDDLVRVAERAVLGRP